MIATRVDAPAVRENRPTSTGALGAACGLIAASLGTAAALAGERWVAGFSSAFAAIGTALFLNAEINLRRAGRTNDVLTARVAELEARLGGEPEAVEPPAPVEAAAAAVITLEAEDDDEEEALEDPTEALAGIAAAAREASMKDPVTGLFNEQYFLVTVEARIAAARRHLRPVAVVFMAIGDLSEGSVGILAPPQVVAESLKETLREADIACRLPDGRFALILEDTPENGAVWTVERVRRAMAPRHPDQTMWAGVACYPAHAFDAVEIIARASTALTAAREWHQDRIEVATAD